MNHLVTWRRVLARTKRRLRARRSLRALATVGITSGTLAALAVSACRLAGRSLPLAWAGGAVLGLSALAVVLAWFWPLRDSLAAARLDETHGLHDAVRAALEFAASAARSPFMEAHLRDLEVRASTLSAQRAAPLRPPRALRWTPLPGLAWLGAALLLSRPDAQPIGRVPTPTTVKAKLLHDDEIRAFEAELESFTAQAALTPRAAADVRTYNELLERLGTGQLPRPEALRALLALERKLRTEGAEPEAHGLSQLDALAKHLGRLQTSLARALEEHDAQAASEALRALSERLPSYTEEERKRLTEALTRYRERELARAGEQDAEDGLLRKRDQTKAGTPEEPSLLRSKRRELDRLAREPNAASQDKRELSRLSRHLAQAGQDLAEGRTEAAQRELEQAAEALSRFAERQLGGKQQRELAEQVAQLRELLQRAGPPEGPGRDREREQARERRRAQFMRRAQGQTSESERTLSLRPEAPEGRGKQPREQGAGDGKSLRPSSDQGGEPVELLLPTMPTARITNSGGPQHDPHTLDAPTRLAAKHQDSQLRGAHGEGPTRSQVILDAADRGFVHASYQKVYADYRAHAEDVLERDAVPAGYRFYVRRYFQLIRPRDD